MKGVWRESEQCARCLSCLRFCPTQAVALGKKRVIPERCIRCGVCVSICPEHHYQTEALAQLEKALCSPLKKVALVSPLIFAVFIESDPEQIASALYLLGFDEVYLAESGLEMVAKEYENALRHSESFLLASHCPVVVEYIEKFYPDLIGSLAKVFSPELMELKALAETLSPAELVLISACPGRELELDEGFPEAVVITFSDLRQIFSRKQMELDRLLRQKFLTLNLPSKSALMAEGDLLKAVQASEPGKNLNGAVVSGCDQLKQTLDSVRLGEVHYRFLELNFCSGGCIGSPTMKSRLSLLQRKERVVNYLKARQSAERINLRLIPNLKIPLGREFKPKRIQGSEPSPEKVKDTLASLGLGLELAITNCKACGYPSCEEFAKAVLREEAEPSYCIPSLIKKMAQVDERILRSERLASVGQIASALAHEVNNPLGLASGYAQTLASDKRLPPEVKEIVNLIREEIENASSTIQNLLSLSRDRPIKFVRVNLSELLSNTLRLVAPRLETSGISLKLNYLAHPIFLECDPYGLQQVFTNLVLNAWQAMERGGTLYISVKEDLDSVEIKFRDTGTGIRPEHLPRLFDPFFTTKAPGEGTGLGLTIAYNIVERHQGDIRVKSEWGKGTEFTIILPKTQRGSQTSVVKR